MPRLSVLALAVALPACAMFNPARGVAPTGDALRVRFDSKSGTYQAQEVVGGSTYYNADGEAVGSVERTRNVTKRWSRTDVHFYQGDAEVDEQDYYHLAKQPGAVDEIKEARAKMARDLSIGFPLAILGSTASTLAAIGTFGDSTTMRYGGATVFSLAALGGVLLAVRGLETYRKNPLLDRERAVKHANVVEHCFRGSCSREAGGAGPTSTTPPATTSLAMRPASPWSGTWTGTGRSTMRTKDGRTKDKSASVELAIEDRAGTLAITLEPKDAQRCTLEARVDGERAIVRAGQACRRTEPGGEVALTVRDGSALTLRDGELAIALSLDLDLADTSRGKRRTARLLGTMDATARRAP